MDLTFHKIMAYFRNMPRIFYSPQYFYNIFTTNHKLLIVTGSNLNLTLRLLFCPTITTSNSLLFKICCKNVVKML